MKILLLRLRMFFEKKEVHHFIKVFVISLIVIMGLMFYLRSFFEKYTISSSVKNFSEEIEILLQEPRKINTNVIIEGTTIESSYDTNGDENFWQGDALDYRYQLPKHGEPKK